MVGLLKLWSVERTSVPDAHEVVVAASGELSTVCAPLETADLAGVRDELGDLVLGDTDIVVVDKTGASASGEKVLVPAHNTNAGVVTEHAAELGTLLDIPDLDLSRTETSSDVSTVTAPLDRGNVGRGIALEKRVYGTSFRRPDVDGTLKTNGDLVTGRPVEEVEVVVVDETWCIENTLRSSSDTTAELSTSGSRWLDWAVVLRAEVNWARRLWGGRLELEDALVERDAAGTSNRGLVSSSLWRWLLVRLVVVVFIIVNVQTLKRKSYVVFGATSEVKCTGSAGSEH